MAKQRASLILVVVLLFLMAGWWKISSVYATLPSSSASAPVYATPLSGIVIHHSYSGGVQTYSGSVMTQTGCEILSSGIAATGEHPAQITLTLTLIEPVTPCPVKEKATSDYFSLSFSNTDTKNPVLSGVTLNGVSSPFTLVEEH